jgi:hypothetical protein
MHDKIIIRNSIQIPNLFYISMYSLLKREDLLVRMAELIL